MKNITETIVGYIGNTYRGAGYEVKVIQVIHTIEVTGHRYSTYTVFYNGEDMDSMDIDNLYDISRQLEVEIGADIDLMDICDLDR